MSGCKRVFAVFLAFVMLISFAGCEKKRKAHAGAKSVEELCTKVLEVLNDEEDYSEIEKWMDWYGWIAYYMYDQTGVDCDFVTIRNVIEDLDEGPDYIKKHHKEFSEAWEEATGKEISKKALKEYVEMKEEIDNALSDDPEAILDDYKRFAPYDTDFDEDNLHEREKYKIGHYSLRTGDDFYIYLEISYYIDDGNYVCYSINWVC